MSIIELLNSQFSRGNAYNSGLARLESQVDSQSAAQYNAVRTDIRLTSRDVVPRDRVTYRPSYRGCRWAIMEEFIKRLAAAAAASQSQHGRWDRGTKIRHAAYKRAQVFHAGRGNIY